MGNYFKKKSQIRYITCTHKKKNENKKKQHSSSLTGSFFSTLGFMALTTSSAFITQIYWLKANKLIISCNSYSILN